MNLKLWIRDRQNIGVLISLFGILLLVTNHLFAQEQINVRPDHPRIWINAENIEEIRDRNLNGAAKPYWDKILAIADNPPRGDIWDAPYLAFAYLITTEISYARRAIEIMKNAPYLIPGDDGKSVWRPAVAFDWTYNVMTEADRALIVSRLDSSKYLDSAWLDDRLRPIDTFVNWRYHVRFAPAMLGFALSGETANGQKALMVGHKQYEDGYKIFENIFPDGEWAEGFHYRKHAYKFAIAYFKALKSATGMDYFKNSVAFRNYGLAVMYGVRPDNTYSRLDNIFSVGAIDTERSVFLMINDEYRNGHYQWYLNNQLDGVKFNTEASYPLNPLLMGALFYDDSIPETPLTDLPLTYHCRGWGTVFMRDGWDFGDYYNPGDNVFIEFKSGDYYSYHNHLASNSFNIFYQGGLVVENSGYAINSTDWMSQTVAHNTILVYDPDEELNSLENDGGQMWLQKELSSPNRPHDYQEWVDNPGRWESGDISRLEVNPIYSYIFADATAAYKSTKVTNFTRQLVYFIPNIIVVYDRVASTNPSFQKSWLLHFLKEPTIAGNETQAEGSFDGGIWNYDGDLVRVDRDDGFYGRMFCKTLLPQDHVIQKIGGKGYEAWFNGQNHDIKIRDDFEEISNWRIEVEPTTPRLNDIFLHVIFLTKTTCNDMITTSLVQSTSGDPMNGVFIDNDSDPRLCLFASDNVENVSQFSYMLSSSKLVGQLLCDLPESKSYEIQKNGSVLTSGVTSSEGTVFFEDIPDHNASYSLRITTPMGIALDNFHAEHSKNYFLLQNHPNPFNSETRIDYTLPRQATVNIYVYNLMGKKVRKLESEKLQSAGKHSLVWDGTNDQGKKVASGVYLYHVNTGDFSAIKKMLLLQ